MTVVAQDAAAGEAAISAAFDAIEQVEQVMSLYRPQSQISRLNRDRLLSDPDPDLLAVLLTAEELSRLSRGAFDVTVQPLWEVWSQSSGELPAAEDVAAACRHVDWRRVDIGVHGIRLRGESTAITLNGIAQGFALDRVMETLRQAGIEQALIDTGEIGGLGRRPDQSAWRIGIDHPRTQEAYTALAELDGRCLATSGDYATSFSPDRRHHHLLDPRTGKSSAEVASVSVLAPSGMWADGLSTALCVLGVQQGLRLMEQVPETDALFVLKDGRTIVTPGFPEVA